MTTSISEGVVAGIYRYPVKGMTADRLSSTELEAGKTLAFDRAFAIENGPGRFDPEAPKYIPKVHFVMLMKNAQLASLKAEFDEVNLTLRLTRDGVAVATGDLKTEAGRQAIEQAVAATVTTGLRGPPRIVQSKGHSFSDVSAKCLHIVNLASLRALEAALGASIDPLRFRPNLIIDGLPAWSEFAASGTRITAGNAVLKVLKRTERCAAVNVNPSSAARDLTIPPFMWRTYGHTDFGIYAKVATGGTIANGDPVIFGA